MILGAYSLALLVLSVKNIFFIRGYPVLTKVSTSSSASPLVSIIVPVRNEAGKVGACVDSLLSLLYPNKEIIIVDGNSTDKTPDILKNYKTNVTVLSESNLPKGWIGKNWACHTGYKMSKGEILLFTDGDTLHNNNSLTLAVETMKQNGVDMMTVIPRMEMISFWEKALLPVVSQMIAEYIGGGEKANNDRSKTAWATGQYILIQRSVYESIGGHEAIRNEIWEDSKMARKVRSLGLKMRVFNGANVLTTRLYTSLVEIWDSVVKNNFCLSDYSVLKHLIRIADAFLKLQLPFLILIVGIVTSLTNLGLNDYLIWGFILSFIAIGRVFVFSRIARWESKFVLILPITGTIYLGIMMVAMLRNKLGLGVSWKGRKYIPNQK